VQANDLGHTGLIRHSVETNGSNYTGVPIDGTREIIDNDAPAIVVETVGGNNVSEGGTRRQPLRVRPTRPDGTVNITLVVPAVDPPDELRPRGRVVGRRINGAPQRS
jgi:hypothetical protein